MKMKLILYIVVCLFACGASLKAESEYEFVGRHLIISYMGCDAKALNDEHTLKEKMKEAALAADMTILSSSHHHFKPSGVTQILLLSESHASIHTYPEHDACFVDLFTCGTTSAMDKFDKLLTEYLKPRKVSHKLLSREEDCAEIAYTPLVTQDATL